MPIWRLLRHSQTVRSQLSARKSCETTQCATLQAGSTRSHNTVPHTFQPNQFHTTRSTPSHRPSRVERQNGSHTRCPGSAPALRVASRNAQPARSDVLEPGPSDRYAGRTPTPRPQRAGLQKGPCTPTQEKGQEHQCGRAGLTPSRGRPPASVVSPAKALWPTLGSPPLNPLNPKP